MFLKDYRKTLKNDHEFEGLALSKVKFWGSSDELNLGRGGRYKHKELLTQTPFHEDHLADYLSLGPGHTVFREFPITWGNACKGTHLQMDTREHLGSEAESCICYCILMRVGRTTDHKHPGMNQGC